MCILNRLDSYDLRAYLVARYKQLRGMVSGEEGKQQTLSAVAVVVTQLSGTTSMQPYRALCVLTLATRNGSS